MEPRTLIDCRWLNKGGAGRVTELLLRGLAADPGETGWVLWGPPEVERLAWPGARVVPEEHDPRMWNGQRDWWRIPPCSQALFVHQQRPLRRLPAVTMIHDTIPLRFSAGAADREIKRRFLRRVAAISRQVVTPSEFSRRRILEDLGVPPSKVSVTCLPGDPEMSARICRIRRSSGRERFALYLGLFLPSKNLDRLVEAFGRTEFRAGGGRLVLAGGRPEECAALARRYPSSRWGFLEVLPFAGQPEMERLMATCAFLVQPSLEEGFGLPAWEALCSGVPVCASSAGSLPEVTRGVADTFDPRSVDRMAAALDLTAERSARLTAGQADAAAASFLAQAPTIASFAAVMTEILQVGPPARSL